MLKQCGILNFFTGTLNTVAWQYILLPCVLIGGLYFTVRNRGLQFTKFGYAMRNTVGRMFRGQRAGEGEVTPLQAVSTALAATVGTGNIIGTGQAIALGGYGAVFWLWVAAMLGMIIKYAEVVLSIRYRRRDEKGDWVGGPMYYITEGMGHRWRPLAVLFCVFAVLASFGIGNMSQANSIMSSVCGAAEAFFPEARLPEKVIGAVTGVVLAALVAAVLFGGMQRIGRVTEKVVPAMCALYILLTVTVILHNWENIGSAFRKILLAAFAPQAVMGAGSGILMRQTVIWGLRRSAFSNEAGLGSAAIAHAAAQTDSPVRQGMYGIFEVFVDTIVVCTLTALAIIVSGVPVAFGTKPGTELITAAFATAFGRKFAAAFVAAAMILFAFTTLLGWALYGARCVQYLAGTRAVQGYRVLFVLMAVVGAVASTDVVWDIADTFNGLMAIPNFIALFALSGTVAELTRAHFAPKRHLMHRQGGSGDQWAASASVRPAKKRERLEKKAK